MLLLLFLEAGVIAEGAVSASGVATVAFTGAQATTQGAVSAAGTATVAFVGQDAAVPVAPVVPAGAGGIGAGGGGAWMAPEDVLADLRRLERRRQRIQKTHIIKFGEWPEDVGHVETDPLDWREILDAQPRRQPPSSHHDGDDEEALMELLMFAA